MKSTIVQNTLSLLSPAGPGARLSVLLFHKVPTAVDPLTTGELDLARFEKILDFLARNTTVLPLTEATARLQAGTLPRRAMALTFDDGYAEWIDNVSPALRKRNLPATFFVTTGPLAGVAFWHERIVAAVRALPDTGFTLPYGFGNYTDLRLPAARARLVEELQARLKYAALADRIGAIEALESQAHSAISLPRPFDADSVRLLHSQGFDIGAHTVDHPILTECTPAQARAEIGASKDALEAIIGGRVHSFAYPNGRPNTDYGATHVEMVKSLGYKLAVTTSNGAAARDSDMFQLPRFTPWGLSDERVAFQLARNMRTRPVPLNARRPAAGASATDVRCLLVASAYPPAGDGAVSFYDKLCQGMPAGSLRVLAPATTDGDGNGATACPVDRIGALRPASGADDGLRSAWRMLFHDVPLYVRALIAAARIVRKHNINVVCIGELEADGWLGMALKKLVRIKLVVHVDGPDLPLANRRPVHGNKCKAYLDAADKIVAGDAATCDALTSLMGVKPEAVVLIQHGIGLAQMGTPVEPPFLKTCERLLSTNLRP